MIFTWALIVGLFVLNTSMSVFQYSTLKKKCEEVVKSNRQVLEYDYSEGFWQELMAKINGKTYEKMNTLPTLVTISQKISQPPSPFIFISGTSTGLIPDGANMRCFEEPEFASFIYYNPYMNPGFSIDWTTVMIYVISFFCICFSYNAFSGEREDGTLKLMLANNLSYSSIISAKLGGLLVVFLIPVLLGIIISCLIFEFSPVLDMGMLEYTKIAYFFPVSALLICFTILAGFLISVLTQKSYVSLIICLVCWSLMVIIIPNVTWIITRQTDKVPTEITVKQEEELQIDALKDCYTGWQGKQNIERVLDRKECIDRQTTIHNSLWNRYHNIQFEQTAKAIGMSKISPFGLFRFLGDKISGNNFYGYVSFFEQVRNYQLAYREYIISKDSEDAESQHLIWNDRFCKELMSQQKVNTAEIPEFTLQHESFDKVIVDTLVDLVILCLWCIGLFAATFVAFVRYDVR
jgi:ABC-type transport system involved in multi-copper enzyme maturation permease subunit